MKTQFDVIVCGGGPAGIGAAVAAACGGARTLLVERYAHLGGMATGAGLQMFGDSPGGPVFNEMVRNLQAVGAAEYVQLPGKYHAPGRLRFHGETAKVVLAKMLRDVGVEVLFDTMVESACKENHLVRGIHIANKSGRNRLEARVVIDATADGDVAASAGAEFQQGDPEDGRIQHVNFRWALGKVDDEKWKSQKPSPEKLLSLACQARAKGRLHPPANIFSPTFEMFPFETRTGDPVVSSYWEIEKINPVDPEASSRTLLECQAATLEVTAFCRENLPGYENCRIERLPTVLGTRESRRITGKYVLTGEEVIAGRKFADGVARACFWMDFHDSPPGHTLPCPDDYVRGTRPAEGDWYEIPYRCLVPKEVRGLLVAGRCISSDRQAHASLRIMPTCMFLGAAAGTAAALAVTSGVHPHELDGGQVRQLLNNWENKKTG